MAATVAIACLPTKCGPSVACAVTSNLKRAQIAGNVALDAGEGGLAKASVVEVSKVSTVAQAELGDCLGQVSAARVQQILAGLRFGQRF